MGAKFLIVEIVGSDARTVSIFFGFFSEPVGSRAQTV